MPTLKAIGSSELASVSALGWRTAAIFMNSPMTGTDSRYIERPMAMTTTSAAGIAEPTSESSTSRAACTGNATSRVRMPKRASSHPAARFETSVMRP